jgi:hypothetical protein
LEKIVRLKKLAKDVKENSKFGLNHTEKHKCPKLSTRHKNLLQNKTR